MSYDPIGSVYYQDDNLQVGRRFLSLGDYSSGLRGVLEQRSHSERP